MLLIAASCSRQSRAKPKASEQAPADPVIEVSSADNDSSSADPCAEMFSTFFVKADSIAYNGFEVIRLPKTIHDKEENRDIPVTDAVLKSNGKIIQTFDGVYFGLGNETEFGLASMVGGDSKQLLVSQTVPRGGRHWIVDLSSKATTLFDSYDWDLGAEDVCVHDYDGDGVSEISMAITNFWGFGTMSMMESPLPGVVFKYEPGIGKYMPDKNAFARGLSHIDEDVHDVDPNEKPRNGLPGPYLAVRLDIFLRYVYAGREGDGWSFFEKTYNLPDKKDIERKIREALRQEPVYNFVYRGIAKKHDG